MGVEVPVRAHENNLSKTVIITKSDGKFSFSGFSLVEKIRKKTGGVVATLGAARLGTQTCGWLKGTARIPASDHTADYCASGNREEKFTALALNALD